MIKLEALRDKLNPALECELCERWDMDCGKCSVGHRPRHYDLENGPNEECHGRIACADFDMATTGMEFEITILGAGGFPAHASITRKK